MVALGWLMSYIARENEIQMRMIASKRLLSDLFKDIAKKAYWMRKTIDAVREKGKYLIYDQYSDDIIILTKFLFQQSITEDEYMRLGVFYTTDILKINQIDKEHYSIHMNLSEIINSMLVYTQLNYNCIYDYSDTSDIYGEIKINQTGGGEFIDYSINYHRIQLYENNYLTLEKILYKILNEERVTVSEEVLKDIEYYLFPQKIDEDELFTEDINHNQYGYNKGKDNSGIKNNTVQYDVNYNSISSNIFNKRQMDCDDETPSTKRQKIHKENRYRWKIYIYWDHRIAEPFIPIGADYINYLNYGDGLKCSF
jgi:hypothetical protein